MLGVPNKRKSKHVRSVTRFCDEANIGEEDELDLAEFIVAAHYLETEANDEQLMEAFMEIEDNLGNQNPKEVIKQVLEKVEEKYGIHTELKPVSENESKETNNENESNINDEIIKMETMDPFQQDMNWQNEQLGQLLNQTYNESNVQIAQNLLETTALTAQQIADLTGLPIKKVEELEEEFASDFETDEEEEEERPMRKSEMKQLEKQIKTTTKSIKANDFSKALAITKNDIVSVDKIINNGKELLEDSAETALELLKKFKIAVSTEGPKDGQDPRQHFKKLRTQLLSVQFTPEDRTKISKTIAKAEQKQTEENKWPKPYRVVIHPGALAKLEEDVKSKIVGKIEIGSIVLVEEIKDRRCRISKPMEGWLSITSSQGKVILEKEGTKSKLMQNAIAKERARQTKVLILKSVTTLNETTVERILIKSDWNLRRAIEAFYIAKFKTQQFLKTKEEKNKNETTNNTNTKTNTNTTNTTNTNNSNNNQSKKKGFWGSWKGFTKNNN